MLEQSIIKEAINPSAVLKGGRNQLVPSHFMSIMSLFPCFHVLFWVAVALFYCQECSFCPDSRLTKVSKKIGHLAELFPTTIDALDFLFRFTLSRNHWWILHKSVTCHIKTSHNTRYTRSPILRSENVRFRESTPRSTEQIWEPVLHQTSMPKIAGCISRHLNKLDATTSTGEWVKEKAWKGNLYKNSSVDGSNVMFSQKFR